MATKLVIRNGQVSGVYDDRFRPLLEALGVMKIQRASEVEFDATSGDWIATLASGHKHTRECYPAECSHGWKHHEGCVDDPYARPILCGKLQVGDVIARGKNRGECIAREVEYLESVL